MDKINITINQKELLANAGETILEAAKRNNIYIPTLCNESRLEPFGGCRLCLVEIKGAKNPQPSCAIKVLKGMEIETDTPKLFNIRKMILELLLSDHPQDCLICDKCGDCELQDLAYQFGLKQSRFIGQKRNYPIKTDNELIEYDANRCILCGRCVRICQEVESVHALGIEGKGFNSRIAPAFNRSLLETTCELCGLCVSTCPTGSLYEKQGKGKGRIVDLKKVRTTCGYCGVGCVFDFNVKDGKIVKVTSEAGSVPNDGNLCIKGKFDFDFIYHPDRLTVPLIRTNDKNSPGKFRQATWDEALDLVAKKIKETKEKSGAESISLVSSSRCTNEENYLMQKLARTAIGTNNIDQCARTCHCPTAAGLNASFGTGAATNSIAEIPFAEVLFIIGANPTEAHPIIGMQIKKAARRGAKIIVADPRKIWLTKVAKLHLAHRPGTDVALINAIMNVIINNGLEDKRFIKNRTEGYEQFRELILKYIPERASKICGVEEKDIIEAALTYAKADKASILYSLGITEHTSGTENVRSLANLALLTGHIGRMSAGVNPLRGQNNVQGSCDMGALPDYLPGYQKITDELLREKFEKAWGVKITAEPGFTTTDTIEMARQGKVKAMYVVGEDLVLSEPHNARVKEALKKLDFLVVQDIFMCETAKYADVILPAASFAEKDGTFTNTERRVQRVRQAIEPIGQSRPDWQIIIEISNRLGYNMNYTHPGEIWDEVASLVGPFAGINYSRIEKKGLQWPCPHPTHPGTVCLHEDGFPCGRGRFAAVEYLPPAEEPDKYFPFILSTGRTLYHYNVGTMTRRSIGSVHKTNEAFVEINQKDAERLNIKNGQMVKVKTRRGVLKVKAKVEDKLKPGVIWMPFHFLETETNILTNSAFDRVTKTGEYKVCAANVLA